MRTPLKTALAQLEKHAALNDALRQKALSEGWMWDLGTGQLYRSTKGPPRHDDDDFGASRARDDANASAVACARCLARGEPAARARRWGDDDDDEPAHEDDANAFSLQRAIAFTRALMVDDEEDAAKAAAKGSRHKHRHKHAKHPSKVV